MPTEVDVYHGRARRRCPECGVEIEIERPTRVLGRDSSPSWRKAFRTEIARQVSWEMCCESCRDWWTRVLVAVERPEKRSARTTDRAGSDGS